MSLQLKYLFILALLTSCNSGTNQENAATSPVGNVAVTEEQRFDYLTWKIRAANGTWHFEREHAENTVFAIISSRATLQLK